MRHLRFGLGNAKLGKTVATFDIPAGWTCCGSRDCGDKVDPQTAKLIPNPNAKFRCFAANSELIFPTVRTKRWNNFNLIRLHKTENEIAKLITVSLFADSKATKAPIVRIHTSGDFFNQSYFNAWLKVAKAMPEKTFYAYTKSLKFWVAKLGEIPANFHLTASYGGKNDDLIEKFNLKNVKVVFSLEEAKEKGLEIDHDDSHAFDPDCHEFALLIHGTQPAGTPAMKAIMKLRKKGIMGYNKDPKNKREVV